MSPEEQGPLIRNARTFSDELRDRDGFTIDLDALAEVPSSILLTGGDQTQIRR